MPKVINPPYKIVAMHNNQSAEMRIFGDIGEDFWGEGITDEQIAADLDELNGQPLTVRVNSYGGSVMMGLAIHNGIRDYSGATTCVVEGVAASISSMIPLACDHVIMADNARLMMHGPHAPAYGFSDDLRESADMLDGFADAMSRAFVKKTGRSSEEIMSMLTDRKDHWFSAEQALAFGLIDEVSDGLKVAAHGFMQSRFAASACAAYGDQVLSKVFEQSNSSQQPAAVVVTPQLNKENGMPDKKPVVATVPAPVAAAPEVPVELTVAQAVAAAQAENVTRVVDIRARFSPFSGQEGVQAMLDTCIDDHTVTPQAAADKLLAKLGANTVPLGSNPHVEILEDEVDKQISAASDVLIVRAGVHRMRGNGVEASLVDLSGNPYRGSTLMDLANAAVKRSGKDPRGMNKMEVVGSAFQGTSDFPLLLENVIHKVLLMAYQTAPSTWQRFCKVGDVSDFRAHNRYRVGSIGNLDSLTENGEFKVKNIPDAEKATVSATTKGNIIGITREAIINDDLQALTDLAQMCGRSYPRTIEAAVYSLLAQNSGLGPLLKDGKTLFHSDHGNIGAGSVIAMAAIDADRVLMAKQKDISGNDFLDIRPSTLLVPVGLGGTARSINKSEYDPDTANKLHKVNEVHGLFSDIVDTPRLSGSRRYMFADVNDAPVIEVSFLDGVQEPYIETKNGWSTDGAEIKVRGDFGVSGIDYRGAATNAGS